VFEAHGLRVSWLKGRLSFNFASIYVFGGELPPCIEDLVPILHSLKSPSRGRTGVILEHEIQDLRVGQMLAMLSCQVPLPGLQQIKGLNFNGELPVNQDRAVNGWYWYRHSGFLLGVVGRGQILLFLPRRLLYSGPLKINRLPNQRFIGCNRGKDRISPQVTVLFFGAVGVGFSYGKMMLWVRPCDVYFSLNDGYIKFT